MNEARRTEALAAFSTLTDLPPLERVLQRGRDAMTARITLCFNGHGQVRLTGKQLWSQAELARVVSIAIGEVPDPVNAGDWRRALKAMFRHAVEVEEAEEERFDLTVLDWVRAYTARATNDPDGAIPRRQPYFHDDQVHTHAQELAKYVRREYSEQVTLTELRRALVDLGFERRTIHYRKRGADGRQSSVSYYVASTDTLDREPS